MGKNLGQILKKFAHCRSVRSRKMQSSSKCKSWSDSEDSKKCDRRQVAPEGCFSVYVGPDKERFVIKTEYANHPLFKLLLDEAEMEYGYNSDGPLALPCHVDLFHKILCEMDNDDIPQSCNFAKGYTSYHLLTPPRIAMRTR